MYPHKTILAANVVASVYCGDAQHKPRIGHTADAEITESLASSKDFGGQLWEVVR